jgi:hypothetical protein
MPYEGARRPYPTEWYGYRERQQRHHERHPDYPAGWHRPTETTAKDVWALVSAAKPDLSIDAFLPGHEWLTPDENDALRMQAMRAFVVALDAVLRVGEGGSMLTTNHVFDALARHWSDTYRAVREAGRAFASWDMTAHTVRASWRDLLRNGVRLDVPWAILRDGLPGVYTTERIFAKGRPAGRRIVFDRDDRLRQQLVEIIAADPVYRRPPSANPRLLLANENLPERGITREIAGEWSYNVAEVGPRSVELIRRLEAARLYLHVPTFFDDMRRLEARRDELETLVVDDATHAEYLTIDGQLRQHEGVRRRLQSITPAADGCVEIKSGFYKGAYGRYYATHFWPTEVTGKAESEEAVLVAPADPGGAATDEHGRRRRTLSSAALWQRSTRRGRWFRAESKFEKPGWAWEGAEEWTDDWGGDRRPLVGVDISASQFQNLAVFCGLADVERELAPPNPPLKATLATMAVDRGHDPYDPFQLSAEYTGADDPALLAAVKLAARNLGYGSDPKQIVRDLLDIGPGLGDAANLERLLRDTSVWKLYQTYLPVCRAAADAAYARDPYAGFEFTDPFDGARVRWNPIRRRERWVGSGATRVYVHSPAGKPNAAGDYKVSLNGADALRRKVAPCLAHVLDTLFAGLVIEKLNALGVRDIVHLHDCWMVASDATPALDEAVAAAGEPWLRQLGPAYAALEQYLPPDTRYGQLVRGWRRQWQERVAAGAWPRFRVDPAKLLWLES